MVQKDPAVRIAREPERKLESGRPSTVEDVKQPVKLLSAALLSIFVTTTLFRGKYLELCNYSIPNINMKNQNHLTTFA